ncbi:ATP-dependent RNA helicase dbp6 [Gnomoniopsis sp. IMI 355080]|nr:ATP-dependent RNA helicase dbp6 [Gnomoniopsis sp. IMI 355080]
MYARYIPPPKGGKPPAPQPDVEAPPAVASPAVSSATPYARYVPPARSAPRPAAAFNPSATPTPAPRLPPISKTHLNAAAIPPPESLAPKIVFNYDEDEPSPSKKRKIDSPEPATAPDTKESKKENKEKSADKKEKKDKKDKKRKEKEEQEDDGTRLENRKIKKEKSEQERFAFEFDDTLVESENNTAAAESHSNDVATELQKAGSVDQSTKVNPAKATSKDKRKRNEDDGNKRHKSVLERAAKALKEAQKLKAEATEEVNEEDGAEPVEAHGLEPLPQPEPIVQDTSRPTYETLPTWIANPIRVTPETKASFVKLGITKEVAEKLESKGYESAFAVQTAVIPLLLPHPDRQGDVVVSAATGSGKTLAYVLPMVRDISQGVITRLRGLIVVPTRELVLQAKEVCEACASACSGPNKKTVRIGISMGNKQFELEQADLVEEEQRYDPAGHQKWLQEHFDQDFEVSLFDNKPKPLPDHVMDYVSKVDILICTPGRLVDHITHTAGFTLDYVRWLVVDEADKLLAQTFQDWLPVVMPRLSTTNKPGARDFPDSNKSGVRKVVLSATMTRDLSLLNGLKLSRPKLVSLEGSREEEQTQEGRTEHVLPELLEESAIKARDPALKPLYLVELLNSSLLSPMHGSDDDVEMKDVDKEDASSVESESESDSSDTDSSDDDSDDSDSESIESSADSASSSSPKKTRSSILKKPFSTTVLIFTKSNETAIRLSRLLSLLSPPLAPLIGTLTSTTRSSQRRKTLHAFASRKLRILVASDLVARGIDLANLDHVINYDMPTSVASYVHRVGRTARAGRSGKAWTLFTKTEAGWFWTAVAGKGESKSRGAAQAGRIKRKGKVGDTRIDDRWDEERLAKFEGALERLGKEASEMRKRR